LLILVTVHHLSVLFEQEKSRTMNLDVSNYSNYPIFQALKHGGGQIWVQEDQHPAQSVQVKFPIKEYPRDAQKVVFVLTK
jgi:hypothetical protein